MRRSVACKQSGLTLIELLLTLVVTVMLVGILSVALTNASRARDLALEKATDQRQAQTALALLTNDLVGAQLNERIVLGDFIGTDDDELDSIECLTTNVQLPASNSPAIGLALVRWYLVEEPDPTPQGDVQYTLVREITNNVFQTTQPVYERQVILRGLIGWEVTYLGASGWVDDWDSLQTELLPSWVKIRLLREVSEAEVERSDKSEEALQLWAQTLVRVPMGPDILLSN